MSQCEHLSIEQNEKRTERVARELDRNEAVGHITRCFLHTLYSLDGCVEFRSK